MIRNRTPERGALSVEFALVVPIFVLTLFGIVEFGKAFYSQQLLTTAAREAARYGVVASYPRPNASEIQAVALEFLEESGVNPENVTVNVEGAGGTIGENLTVEVLYPIEFAVVASMSEVVGSGVSSGESGAIPSSIVLSATNQMRLE